MHTTLISYINTKYLVISIFIQKFMFLADWNKDVVHATSLNLWLVEVLVEMPQLKLVISATKLVLVLQLK